EKIIERLFSCIARTFFSPFLSDLYGGGSSVMTVRHINPVHFFKYLLDLLNHISFIDSPYSVAHTILSLKIIAGIAAFSYIQQSVKLGIRRVCKKNRSGLGMAGLYMTDTVCFLLRPRILMPLDHMSQIVIHRCTGSHTGLHMVSHTELIDIITGLHILTQISGIHQLPKKLSRLFIYLGTIHIRPFRKICFRTIHPQK